MSDTTPHQPKFRTEDRVQNLVDATPFVKLLLFGDPGVGKTVFACQAPSPLLIDAEDGWLSLQNHPEIASRVKHFEVQSFNDLDTIFWDLKAGAYPERETIIVDTISELQMRALDEFIDKENRKGDRKAPHPLLASQQDYNINTQMMRRMVTSFRTLPRNIIIIAHFIEEKDDVTKVIQKRPAVTPKLARTLMGLFDVIGFMDFEFPPDPKAAPIRRLQLQPTRNVQTKTRIGGLPPFILNPTFDMLIEAKKKMIDENKDNKEQGDKANAGIA